jgi:hypothetical protein
MGILPEEEGRDWVDHMVRSHDDGTFFASGAFYTFHAVKVWRLKAAIVNETKDRMIRNLFTARLLKLYQIFGSKSVLMLPVHLLAVADGIQQPLPAHLRWWIRWKLQLKETSVCLG